MTFIHQVIWGLTGWGLVENADSNNPDLCVILPISSLNYFNHWSSNQNDNINRVYHTDSTNTHTQPTSRKPTAFSRQQQIYVCGFSFIFLRGKGRITIFICVVGQCIVYRDLFLLLSEKRKFTVIKMLFWKHRGFLVWVNNFHNSYWHTVFFIFLIKFDQTMWTNCSKL